MNIIDAIKRVTSNDDLTKEEMIVVMKDIMLSLIHI